MTEAEAGVKARARGGVNLPDEKNNIKNPEGIRRY